MSQKTQPQCVPQTRRSLLLLGVGMAVAAPAMWSKKSAAQAPGGEKITKEFAGYVASGGEDRCENCTRYMPGTGQDNGTCIIVEGAVIRDGWCKFFDN